MLYRKNTRRNRRRQRRKAGRNTRSNARRNTRRMRGGATACSTFKTQACPNGGTHNADLLISRMQAIYACSNCQQQCVNYSS